LLEQNQRVADIITVGKGMSREDRLNALRQAPRPALTLGGVPG